MYKRKKNSKKEEKKMNSHPQDMTLEENFFLFIRSCL